MASGHAEVPTTETQRIYALLGADCHCIYRVFLHREVHQRQKHAGPSVICSILSQRADVGPASLRSTLMIRLGETLSSLIDSRSARSGRTEGEMS